MKAEEIDCTAREAIPLPIAHSHAQLRNPEFRDRDLRDFIVGGHTLVPVLDGTMRPYINLDNAASTPIARYVKDKVDESLEWYSAVHRGAGFKSQVSSLAYEEAREAVGHFVGTDLKDRTCIFVRNATEAINRCAGRLNFGAGDVILTTLMEHHSNMLAWRKRSTHVEYIDIDGNGAPMISDLQAKLAAHKGKVKLVAVSGGSNVTGVIPDIHYIARLVHEAGAYFLVDAAQLAPHRPIRMGEVGAPESIDFLAMSAHKMYAPMGSGVLIGPTEAFRGTPELVGGGAVLFVSEESVMWSEPPDNEEAGSPNVPGVIAMAAATRFIQEDLGWDWLIEHERDLTSYAIAKLNAIPGLKIYGPRDPSLPEDRLGVIAITLADVNCHLAAAVLSHEYGIGTRVGCFCAHPYLMHLFHVPQAVIDKLSGEIEQGDRSHIPGALRLSFGFYNTREDIDAAVAALSNINEHKWQGHYESELRTGDYTPIERETSPAGWFTI